MKENSVVFPPINFNRWKHHTGFINQQIKFASRTKDINYLKKHLIIIGESQMDLYFGKIASLTISGEIIAYLKKEKVFRYDKFIGWLANDDYKLVHLSDKSIWVISLGENRERYIHIHPGRYSPNTIRVKAATLKTAILVLYFEQVGELEIVNTQSVNQIRKKWLNEPPIKSFSNASGLGRILSILNNYS